MSTTISKINHSTHSYSIIKSHLHHNNNNNNSAKFIVSNKDRIIIMFYIRRIYYLWFTIINTLLIPLTWCYIDINIYKGNSNCKFFDPCHLAIYIYSPDYIELTLLVILKELNKLLTFCKIVDHFKCKDFTVY